MKITIISDTHARHSQLSLTPGDLLIHAGDFSKRGKIDDLLDVNEWLGQQPFKYKVIIAGNHDFYCENNNDSKDIFTNAIYLQDSSVTIEGIKIYGSPWQPEFF